MSEKRIDTVAARVTPEEHDQLAILANMDDLTVSSLLQKLIGDYLESKRSSYLQLSRAFGKPTGLQG